MIDPAHPPTLHPAAWGQFSIFPMSAHYFFKIILEINPAKTSSSPLLMRVAGVPGEWHVCCRLFQRSERFLWEDPLGPSSKYWHHIIYPSHISMATGSQLSITPNIPRVAVHQETTINKMGSTFCLSWLGFVQAHCREISNIWLVVAFYQSSWLIVIGHP